MMKKYILITALLAVSFAAHAQQQKPDSSSTKYLYTTSHVFSGQIKNVLDSVFYLRYTFTKQHFQQFAKLVLEDSRGQHSINLSNPDPSDSIEVKSAGNQVYLVKKNIDPNNPPVLLYGEDKHGHRSDLWQRTPDGEFQNAGQLKEIIRLRREAVKQVNR